MEERRKLRVLMAGAGQDVRGGIASVVSGYYAAELNRRVDLKYIATVHEGNHMKKLTTAAAAYVKICAAARQYDLLHIHMSHRSSFWRKAPLICLAHAAGLPVLIHLHGSEFDLFYEKECSRQQQRAVRKIFGMASCVIALSESWRDWLCRIAAPEKILVLHNAVLPPTYQRTDYSDRNVLFLGRLGQRKGTYDLLHAIPALLQTVPDVHFFLAGDGDVSLCRKICQAERIEHAVDFPGWVTGRELETYLHSCSTLVLPSYHEGMPMAILEAMACGSVVVSTPVGGIPQVIRDGQNGFLTPPGDCAGLTAALQRALTAPDRMQIGARARETVCSQFHLADHLEQLLAIYAAMVPDVSARRRSIYAGT